MKLSFKNSVNRTRILQEIWTNQGISRIEISEKLGLNKSTITKITNDLIDSSIVRDYKKIDLENSAGRKRVGLEINTQFGFVVGLEIQTTKYKACILDLYGGVISKYSGDIPNGDFLTSLVKIIDSLLKEEESKGNKIIGLGIGVSGNVDTSRGVLLRSNPLNIYSETNVYDFLYKKYSFPVFMENDANCCCYGELSFKKGNRDNNFLTALGEVRQIERLTDKKKGLAIGLGIVINGEVVRGDCFTAGEFKSLYWKKGNRSQLSKDSGTFNDELLVELLKHLALLINTFNFTKIIFSGLFIDYKSKITQILKEEIKANWLYDTEPDVIIEFSSLKDDSVCYGAAGMVVKNFFTVPMVEKVTKKSDLRGIDLLQAI